VAGEAEDELMVLELSLSDFQKWKLHEKQDLKREDVALAGLCKVLKF
jgi:hypothetical protein